MLVTSFSQNAVYTARAASTMTLVRNLAQEHDSEELEGMLNRAIEGEACCGLKDAGESVNVLAKAQFVRGLIDEGTEPREAMRELGRRMRRLQG